MILLLEPAKEGSTYGIYFEFRDLDGGLFHPKTTTWTLSDLEGNIINSQSAVPATVIGTNHTFILTGDDLTVADTGDDGKRVLTVEGTFDATYGTDLDYCEEVQFPIEITIIKTDPVV